MMYNYDKDVDYQSEIDKALSGQNYALAAVLEQQRNAKVDGENLTNVAKTDMWAPFLEGSNIHYKRYLDEIEKAKRARQDAEIKKQTLLLRQADMPPVPREMSLSDYAELLPSKDVDSYIGVMGNNEYNPARQKEMSLSDWYEPIQREMSLSDWSDLEKPQLPKETHLSEFSDKVPLTSPDLPNKRWELVRNENFDYNGQLRFKKGDFILNQNDSSVAKMRYANRESWYNGCGWVAVYNALTFMNKEAPHPADIVYELEGSALLNGKFGTNPLGMRDYFRNDGYKASAHLFGDYDAMAKSGDAAILHYLLKNDEGKIIGGHYIAVQWNGAEYKAYNLGKDGEDEKFGSINDFLDKKGYIKAGIIVVNKE